MSIEPSPPPLRVFVAGLMHETNSFSPMPTVLRHFEEDVCYRPPSSEGRAQALAFAGYGDAIAVASAHGDTVIEGPCFWTQPSAPISATLYGQLRTAILRALADAGPIDVIILALHGAMMAEGCDDCEGDLLLAVRAHAGPSVPVGAIFDLHGNVSRAMVASGALLVGVKEYPHSDYRERTEELYALLAQQARSDTRLKTCVRTIPVLSLQGTTDPAMGALVRHLYAMEGRDGVRSITMMHGFPWSDWQHSGASVIVIGEDADSEPIEALADDIASRYLAVLRDAPVARHNVSAAVNAALTAPEGDGPVVIADCSDNPGGGAACDSTFLLHELVQRECSGAAVGMIWDPQAARMAADAGKGAHLSLRVGGKIGPFSGEPVDLEVEVLKVRADIKQRVFSGDPTSPLGLAVSLRANGIDIVINSIRQQVFDPACFTQLGIDLADKRIVVVKSSQHFRALFDRIASRTIYCNAPGSMNTDLAMMPYRNLGITSREGSHFSEEPAKWFWQESAPICVGANVERLARPT